MNKNITELLIPDWIELYILLNGAISRDDILWEFDNLDEKQVDNIFFILDKRLSFYSFKLYSLELGIIKSNPDLSEKQKVFYLFSLILAIYGNWFESQIAWKLFERLSNEAFRLYLWWKSIVFGFPDWTTQNLSSKIDNLANEINESRWIQNPLSTAKDDKLDIVTIREIDSRRNKLIMLSQCAAGHDWKTKLTQLSLHKWQQYINFWVQPLRWFSCVEFIDDEEVFYDKWLEWGILFDRSRIMNFLTQLIDLEDNELEADIRDWITRAAWEYDFNLT